MKIGIDLGGTNIKVGVVDGGRIVYKDSRPTNLAWSFERTVDEIVSLVKVVVEKAGINVKSYGTIGIGSPGLIDTVKGEVIYSNNIKWKNAPLAKELQGHLGVPIKIHNDAKVAALGEAVFGAGKDFKKSILLTLGTGVGGGVIKDGKIEKTQAAAGALFGHMSIDYNGRLCTCGRHGCLETYASATALIADAKAVMKVGNLDGKAIFDAYRQGNKAAKVVVDNYIKYLGEGVVSIINICCPDAIILGGGLSGAGDILTVRLKEYIKDKIFGAKHIAVDIIVSKLGNDAGIIGASLL
ncbi:MAG: ROK family protein [Firmicutes bacterium]|nr:ROK family protein [Bacillota bacterium]